MNYAVIRKNDIANGPGVRVSVFVSGCRHRCRGCFNAEAWDFDFGIPYTEKTEREILDAAGKEHITGLSLLGGEPFEPENREALARLVRAFHERYPHKTVWCYSGFTFEELYGGRVREHESALALLSVLDVLVDGRFEEDKKDAALLFRGSSNQRILDIPASLSEGAPVPLAGVWKRKMGSGNIMDD
jgi:anaerobic ribonucleoside-triphosphate reductase activating protein